MADLVEPQHHVARRIETRDAGALVIVDRKRAVLRDFGADLIGLPCVSAGGNDLGPVVSIENFGAGDILEIEKPDGKRRMVPFREGIADLAGGRIVVDPVFLT